MHFGGAETKVDELAERFAAHGGRVRKIPATPVFSLFSRSCVSFLAFAAGQVVFGPNEDECARGTDFKIDIRPDDLVIPICHEGMNRSQVWFCMLMVAIQVLRRCAAGLPCADHVLGHVNAEALGWR